MKQLEKELIGLYRALINKEFIAKNISEKCHPNHKLSAINLVRYITLRNQDLRNIHDHLSDLGISSLRTCEGYVMHNVISALRLVKMLNGDNKWQPHEDIQTIGYQNSKKLLQNHTSNLFLTNRRDKSTRIMVTLPSESAHDPEIIRSLLIEGMRIARINLSHDNKSMWEAMVQHIKTISAELDLPCSIYMDLSGPKIRTEKIEFKNQKNKPKDFIRLNSGDHLILTDQSIAGADKIIGKKGEILQIAKVSISLPQIIADARIGDRILFDDGKISSKVIKKTKSELEVVIVGATPVNGIKLKSEKGINLPDTHLNLPSLTEKDKRDLAFITTHADIVGYSFVRTVEDIRDLQMELDKYNKPELGVILKIENKEAFDNLPMLLLEGMKQQKIGVMIARGDLAVELGAVRIAEVQDQIMWICEAAHVPVIWATQVLENLAKTGLATRSEITDAAKSARAESVMLNKGPYIVETVNTLKRILDKMKSHSSKKKSIMRALELAKDNIDRMGN